MRAAAVLLLLLLASRLSGQSCPAADPVAGYPVAATAEAGAAVDSAWLASVARAAAYRWRVPSGRRDAYVGWERVRRRILPPEPRWADDWSPRASHRAVLRLVLVRAGAPRAEVLSPSGDAAFDGSLASITDAPLPGSPPLPDPPPTVEADTLPVVLIFGEVPEAAVHGVVRFAAVQTRVELQRGSLRVMPPPGFAGRFPPTTVKYDVGENGRVDMRSVEFLTAVPAAITSAVRDGLRGARFTPATSNCRPISQTVVQTFGG